MKQARVGSKEEKKLNVTASLRVAVILLLAGTLFVALRPAPGLSSPATVTVPDDYPTIQQAVDAAQSGDTIFVRNGVYKEREVTVRKSLSLIAESNGTVIDSEGNWSSVCFESVNGGVLQGFSITNGYGVYVHNSSNVNVRDNLISGNEQGIVLVESRQNSIINNTVVDNGAMSIFLANSSQNTVDGNRVMFNRGNGVWLENSTYNFIRYNVIWQNGLNTSAGFHVYGICLSYSRGNRIDHNDVAENFEQANGWMSLGNVWDNGYPAGGNYWSDYTGTDYNGDRIGDTPYFIDSNNVDNYPLMEPGLSILPPRPATILSLEVSGQPDYTDNEEISIRISAMLEDAVTFEPVSGASVTIEINDPDGNLWVSDVMTERAVGTGHYEWESNGTILDMARENRLHVGVYIAYVTAWAGPGLTAQSMLQFHVDPASEGPIGFLSPNSGLILAEILVIAGVLVAAICLLIWDKMRERSDKSRRPVVRLV